MGFWGWVFLIFGSALVIGIIQAAVASSRKNSIEARLKELPDFTAKQAVVGDDGKAGIAVDEQRKKVCLISNGANGVSERIISYRDILSAELFEDGSSITKTSRSSQLGGALVGGLVFGGLGAVVGGLSGNTRTSSKIKHIDLRLVVNDTSSPLHDVAFLNGECKKDEFIYKQSLAKARRWHGIIKVLINRADGEDLATQNQKPNIALPRPSDLVADELRKLADLQASGVLTDEEFQKQKARLLGSGGESV